ncbi:MAG: hypothetical protein Q9169_004864 [Polycauliona sp. 2 TL-2023]
MSDKRPIDGYVDPSIPNPNGDGDAPIIIYGYTPTLALAILALVLFALLLLFHIFRLYTTRLYAFSILLIFTTLCEIVGYVFRLRSSPPPVGNPYGVINFVVQYFFIVTAPVFLSAAIYTTLTSFIAALAGRNNASESKKLSPFGLSKRTILGIFITADVIATIVQVAGAALIGVSQSNRKSPVTANNILLAGLAFQVFAFLIFLILLFIFIRKASKVMLSTDTAESGRGATVMLRYTVALVASSLLVYLRTCFRLAETSQGVGGYASSHEAFFGALEFAPIVVAIGLLGWWHPGRLVGRNGLLSAHTPRPSNHLACAVLEPSLIRGTLQFTYPYHDTFGARHTTHPRGYQTTISLNMARPMDAHFSSTANINPHIFSTSVAANHAWGTSSSDGSSYPASIKYGDDTPSLSVAGTSLTSTKNQKSLRLAKIKSSPSHGALAAARTASRQPRRLHRRGRSASETASPVTPTFTSSFAPPRQPHDMNVNPKFSMPPPAPVSKTKIKIKPLLRKLSHPDQNTIDLSKSVAENEGLGIYTSSEVGDSRKASSEMGYGGRSYHNRNTSGNSHMSTTISSHHKHSAQYVHPMRQTPLPYTPPIVGSFANSLESGTSNGAPPVVPHELMHSDPLSRPHNTVATPYAPLPSPRRAHYPPLHIRTGSAPRLASTSQTNLPGTPSSLRKQTTDNNAGVPAMPPSTRTSFDSMFRFRSRANTNEDPVVRAAQVAVLRKEFDERERAKDEVRREQEAKKASREAKKQAKRDESEQRKSESRARKRAQSNTMSEKSATRAAYQAQQEKPSVPSGMAGTTTPGGGVRRRGPTPASAGKALANRWQLFIFWLKTVWLKFKRAIGVGSKG